MAFVFSTSSPGVLSKSNPITFSFPGKAGDDVFVLAVQGAVNSTRGGGNPTLGGSAMTQVQTQVLGSGENHVEFWYLLSPPQAASTLSLPNSSAKSIRIQGVSFTAAGTPVFEGSVIGSGSSVDPSLTYTTLFNNDLLVHVLATGSSFAPTTPNFTNIYINDEGVWGDAFLYQISSGKGAVTSSVDVNSGAYAHILAAFYEQLNQTASPSVIPLTVLINSSTFSYAKSSIATPSLVSASIEVQTAISSFTSGITATPSLVSATISVFTAVASFTAGTVNATATPSLVSISAELQTAIESYQQHSEALPSVVLTTVQVNSSVQSFTNSAIATPSVVLTSIQVNTATALAFVLVNATPSIALISVQLNTSLISYAQSNIAIPTAVPLTITVFNAVATSGSFSNANATPSVVLLSIQVGTSQETFSSSQNATTSLSLVSVSLISPTISFSRSAEGIATVVTIQSVVGNSTASVITTQSSNATPSLIKFSIVVFDAVQTSGVLSFNEYVILHSRIEISVEHFSLIENHLVLESKIESSIYEEVLI